MLREDKFTELFKARLSSGLLFALRDFLINRSLQVEVNGCSSDPLPLGLGCVQGSSLGPRLFTLYAGQISNVIGADHYTSYADDSYVLITGKSLDEAINKISIVSRKHVEYLKSLGLVVNESKSEAVVFTKHGQTTAQIDICGTSIVTKDRMKVLGIIFHCNLSWEPQIRYVLKKCKSKLGVLKKTQKSFSVDQFLKIITTQYYSVLYYCSAVWLSDQTPARLRNLVNTAHYRPLRIALRDFESKLSKAELSNKCQRATPTEWVKYSIANLVIKVINQREPFYLYHDIQSTIYTTRRKPLIGNFFDNSRGKIGKQKLSNRLQFMTQMTTDWIDTEFSKDRLRTTLKNTFFNYKKLT